MGLLGDAWSGLKSTASSAYRMGKKAVSGAVRIGKKATGGVRSVLDKVENVPILGTMVSPITSVVGGALSGAENVIGSAERGLRDVEFIEGLGKKAGGIVRSVQKAGSRGDVGELMRAGRDAGKLFGEVSSIVPKPVGAAALRRAAELARQAQNIARRG